MRKFQDPNTGKLHHGQRPPRAQPGASCRHQYIDLRTIERYRCEVMVQTVIPAEGAEYFVWWVKNLESDYYVITSPDEFAKLTYQTNRVFYATLGLDYDTLRKENRSDQLRRWRKRRAQLLNHPHDTPALVGGHHPHDD